MNDLDLMRDFRADVAPPSPATLADSRAAMFRAAPATPARSRSKRWIWGLAPAGALAAAVAVGAAVARPDASPAPGTATTATRSEAAQVFLLAAAEARQEPALTVRPGQFVHVTSLVAWAGGAPKDGSTAYLAPVEKRREVWLSADGSRTGLLREKPVEPGAVDPHLNDNLPLDAGTPGYLGDLPADKAAMRDYLYAGNDTKNPADRAAFTKVGDTLREHYLRPDAAAALYEAAATIPGTTVVRGADLAGRKGIAVSRTDQGTRHDIIFDARTYRFLGERDVVVGDVPPYPKNTVIGWTAQLKVEIVDRLP
ncbi:CU044_5270 family protein [Paractinoplanes deccanensis]|uniref:CU044_5270 family protein n=1 Tax=Paractinoplanes deccanensis TaxID=113561 RepID=UPI00360B23A9